jgi:DNA-binding NarL/FixJ family response regulator
MRVLLIGLPEERARLRARLNGSLRVVGEFPTPAAAEASHIESDGMLLSAPGEHRDENIGQERLTPREVQVLELLAEGLPNKAIAARLELSDQTVKFYVASIAGKLGAANRTDVVRRAVRRGLIAL